MQHASLLAFLHGDRSPEAFEAEITEEVKACLDGCQKGGVGHIILTDGPTTIVTRDDASRLLSALANERLSFAAANYMADAVIMSDDFDFADDSVAEAFHFVADESVVPTQADVLGALVRIAS